jgi:hypothetical protein
MKQRMTANAPDSTARCLGVVSAFGSDEIARRSKQSFSPAFAVFHICAALNPHTDGIVDAEKKGGASNALTSLVGQTGRPHCDGIP